MTMKPIFGLGAKCLGYLVEDASTIKLITPGGRLLGIYLKNQNQTIRPGGGGLVGYGNLLMTLLED
jgi:hypothetical protein